MASSAVSLSSYASMITGASAASSAARTLGLDNAAAVSPEARTPRPSGKAAARASARGRQAVASPVTGSAAAPAVPAAGTKFLRIADVTVKSGPGPARGARCQHYASLRAIHGASMNLECPLASSGHHLRSGSALSRWLPGPALFFCWQKKTASGSLTRGKLFWDHY